MLVSRNVMNKKAPVSSLSRLLVCLQMLLLLSLISPSLAEDTPSSPITPAAHVVSTSMSAQSSPEGVAWTDAQTQQGDKYSMLPYPLPLYAEGEEGLGLWEKLCYRTQQDPFNLAASLIFLGAVVHTFLAPLFLKLAHHLEHREEERQKAQGIAGGNTHTLGARLCHLLGEIELIFAFWVIPFAFVCASYYSWGDFGTYVGLDTNFTEPLFVAVIMIVAASRPIYRIAESSLQHVANLGKQTPLAWWLSVLTIAPFLGSFITEPAAMTLAAIILSKKIYSLKPSLSFSYATLGLLFVNVSVGGTLTHFAAPPIVMVAGKWEWTLEHMMFNFGWKAMLGILIANAIYYFIFISEFRALAEKQLAEQADLAQVESSQPQPIPLWIYGVSVAMLVFTVYYAHYPSIFLIGFAVFVLFHRLTRRHQEALSIRIPLLVGVFLAGLLILGGAQGWWMQPVLQALAQLGEAPTMALASVLTAFNDNAAVTFLASTVPQLADNMKYAIVAGAVTGGGLTVIANAPNLAGQSILSKHFAGINALQLARWALIPTVVMFLMFYFL